MTQVTLMKMSFMYPYIFNTIDVEYGISIFISKLSKDLVERKYILVIFVKIILPGYPCNISNTFVEMHIYKIS